MSEIEGRTFYFGKLVRNETVPGFAADDSVISVNYHVMDDMEYKKELNKKLHEEADEIPVQSETDNEVVAEIGDLQDVTEALMKSYGIAQAAVDAARQKKTDKRGGFGDQHYIESITVKPGSQWEAYCLREPERYPEIGAESALPEIEKGTYRHNKRSHLYEVLGVSLHTETNEPLVIYRPLYENEYELFARPYAMFVEEVEIDGKMMPRFERVDDEK